MGWDFSKPPLWKFAFGFSSSGAGGARLRFSLWEAKFSRFFFARGEVFYSLAVPSCPRGRRERDHVPSFFLFSPSFPFSPSFSLLFPAFPSFPLLSAGSKCHSETTPGCFGGLDIKTHFMEEKPTPKPLSSTESQEISLILVLFPLKNKPRSLKGLFPPRSGWERKILRGATAKSLVSALPSPFSLDPAAFPSAHLSLSHPG